MKKTLYTLIILISLITSHKSQAETMYACTMDARMCPDGSYVGRSGPNCEFTPCPTVTTPDQSTSTICNDLSIYIVRFGQRNNHVRDLQTYLYSLYNPQGKPTGYFGPLTLSYVKRFQKENNIIQTGFVGPLTRAALKEECINKDTNQTSHKEIPKTCKVWFDGCNTCGRTTVDGPMACTLMACIWANENSATCKESF